VLFLRSPPAGEERREWELSFRRGLALVSVMWGSVMFIPVPAEVTPYVAMGLLLVIAGSVGLCANYRTGVSLISVPCALMASAALMRTGQWLGVATAIGFLVAVAQMVRVARAHNTAITRAMQVAEERKALLEELNVRRREAEGASAAKTFLLTSVSHDLHQPMHSMALLVAAARQRGMADADIIEQIGASVRSMEDLLGALREVSQFDAGAVPLQRRDFALGDVLERVRLQFAPQARAKGLRLHVAGSAVWVRSDVFHIERVLSNLVANAIRYTHSGGVTVRCRARAGTVWIQVWDSGVGIEREHLGKVFEEFFQVSRTPRSGTRGLGLGLSIVQRTVQRLNHALRVRSRPGRGSLFEVGVPLAPAQAPQTMDQ
jgi:signal transduction histidine kinase